MVHYSLDLHEKVVRFVDDGHSKVMACKVFNISKSTIFSWFRKLKQCHSLEPSQPRTGQRRIDLDQLAIAVQQNPDRTLKEHAEDFNVSIFGIWSALKRAGITLKKRQRIRKVKKLHVKSLKK